MATSDSPAKSTVQSAGCLYFDFVPPHAFDQKLKMLHKWFFPITTKPFFAFLNWSSAFDFRIFFGKTLISFNFDQKLTQSIAQIILSTCTLQLIKCFHFQDIIWKMEECCLSKNIELKKYSGKNSDFDFVLLLFTFRTFSSIVAASCFTYISPCKWF